MKKQKFTEHQIIGILRTVETGRSIREVCREQGIAESPYFKWKSKYGGMEASDIKRMKSLIEENSRLKRMYADLSLQAHALKDLIEKKF